MLKAIGFLTLLGALSTGAYLYFHDGQISQDFHLKKTPEGIQLEHELRVTPAPSAKPADLPKPVKKTVKFKYPKQVPTPQWQQGLHEPCGALAWNGGVGCPSFNVYPPGKYEMRPLRTYIDNRQP